MQSFRTELENPVVEKDIIELENKIRQFHAGELDEERFRTLRLARGVYGQRQPGVQMIRIKIPYGKLNARQLERIAAVSDEYSTGLLHITTRQDIQIHHVSLDRTPELWTELERDEITLREACGNTVRNVTASALSGIDPEEVFDVRPYAEAVFQYFLRNPMCQEMGRKVKIAFSNNAKDTGLTFMHDLGFIAKERNGIKGFKVMVAGGLGSQSRQADVLYDFLRTDEVIPLVEAVLRLFERHGERKNRMKARLKFWVKSVGFETFQKHVERELKVVPSKVFPIAELDYEVLVPRVELSKVAPQPGYEEWRKAHVIPQKQEGLFSMALRIRLGNFTSDQARGLARVARTYTGDELTFTVDQNLLLRHIPEDRLITVYNELLALDLVDYGYGTSLDITACPGTDTCNLGIANTTAASNALEEIVRNEYSELWQSKEHVNIKLSGCMNSCGQHMIAHIGFQGMSMKAKDGRVIPASQILLGGGVLGDGQGAFADKVIKIPSKRAGKALRIILDAFAAAEETNFLDFYARKGERYFYELLKPLADIESPEDALFYDWGQEEAYRKEIGVGECAGVVIDLVATLFVEAEEKLALMQEALGQELWADAQFHGYSAVVQASKALLIAEGKRTNSHVAIINQFKETFVDTGELVVRNYEKLALRMVEDRADEAVISYAKEVEAFYLQVVQFRKQQLEKNHEPIAQ
ncbi:MAG: HEPN domain-containing protein [bacterium]|nr:HEPN domain-containing protein [bacterium]